MQRNWAGGTTNTNAAISRVSHGPVVLEEVPPEGGDFQPLDLRQLLHGLDHGHDHGREALHRLEGGRGGIYALSTIADFNIMIFGRGTCGSSIDGGCAIFTGNGTHFCRFFEKKNASATSLLRHASLQPS
jgi:hypothetical protein